MLQRGIYQLHAGHPGQRRPLPAPCYERFHSRFLAFSGNPYAAVRQVPHLTGYAQLLRHLFGAGPEKNALDLSFYSDLLMYFRHRFRLGSGCCICLSKLQTTRRIIKFTCWPYQVTISQLPAPAGAPCRAWPAQSRTYGQRIPAAVLNSPAGIAGYLVLTITVTQQVGSTTDRVNMGTLIILVTRSFMVNISYEKYGDNNIGP